MYILPSHKKTYIHKELLNTLYTKHMYIVVPCAL